MKHATIYARHSPRPDSKNCDSCEKQEDRCAAYCGDNGIQQNGVYRDEAISGGVLDRPGLSQAIRNLQPGWILLVDRPDRLSRELLDTLLIRRQVTEKKAEIVFADGSPTGVGSPEEVFFANILAALAAYERARIIHRCKEGKKRSRKEGKFCGGKLKIGWKMDEGGRVVRCLEERKAIIGICLWAARGESSVEIADVLNNSRCYGLCRGKPWSARTIRKIISRESFWAAGNGDLSLEPTHP